MTRAKASASARAPRRKSARASAAQPRLSRLRQPAEMTVEDWQAGLRRQFGREQFFVLENLGTEPVFSEFAVATIVNMDLPWNPAVLEQRIGRVHGMGQTKSMQVVNFVAQATIEEGMLSVLAFKKPLFSGVLDGGENEVFLRGTHAANRRCRCGGPRGAGCTKRQRARRRCCATGVRSLGKLIDAGLKLVEALAATRAKGGAKSEARAAPYSWIETDAATGKSYLKLPVPEAATVQRLADALSGLLAGLRR